MFACRTGAPRRSTRPTRCSITTTRYYSTAHSQHGRQLVAAILVGYARGVSVDTECKFSTMSAAIGQGALLWRRAAPSSRVEWRRRLALAANVLLLLQGIRGCCEAVQSASRSGRTCSSCSCWTRAADDGMERRQHWMSVYQCSSEQGLRGGCVNFCENCSCRKNSFIQGWLGWRKRTLEAGAPLTREWGAGGPCGSD